MSVPEIHPPHRGQRHRKPSQFLKRSCQTLSPQEVVRSNSPIMLPTWLASIPPEQGDRTGKSCEVLSSSVFSVVRCAIRPDRIPQTALKPVVIFVMGTICYFQGLDLAIEDRFDDLDGVLCLAFNGEDDRRMASGNVWTWGQKVSAKFTILKRNNLHT
jgi:hypothetical protein